jgi:uncharacterized membrane protein
LQTEIRVEDNSWRVHPLKNMTMDTPAFPEPPLPLPLTSSEKITALSHFYRGEMARMSDWRERIDQSSNWAITVVAGMLSITLSTPSSHHGVLLFGMVIVFLLLWIEARRYRFFDVYRARVRMLERSYFSELFAPRADADPAWMEAVAKSLRAPDFHISHVTALSRRLRRNYLWMYLIMLLAWILKISSPRIQDENTSFELARSAWEVVANAAIGPLPGWSVLLLVALFYAALFVVTFAFAGRGGELAHGSVHM